MLLAILFFCQLKKNVAAAKSDSGAAKSKGISNKEPAVERITPHKSTKIKPTENGEMTERIERER